ncbi:KpsF/GutQ family sugar-phosphate isomerase [Clostridium perfringens]|nr:KpsF/GutQ family sugar-phosphate isomerase [Clostridium perfringens]MDU2516346.1 KpsF/GutQ family sugar-phosphate isomerase [Clostridium perfringens]
MIDIAREVFDIEIEELIKVRNKLGNEFNDVIEVILNTKGKVILTGIGKTGIIAKKIAASLASTGTSSFFMQSAEALHGDLGMVNKEDIVIAVSNSGSSQEVLNIIPSLKRIGCKLIALTGNKNSQLANASDYIIDVGVEREACPLDLAPTTSTTATLLMGDAITVALTKRRKFKPENFALYHPGGTLGKRLLTRVKDIMSKDIPKVYESSDLREIIYEISSKRLGLTIVYDDNDAAVGLITDGDIRRNIFNSCEDIREVMAKDIMTKGFKYINSDEMAKSAWEKMNRNNISNLIVLENEKLVGIVTMHDVFEFEN